MAVLENAVTRPIAYQGEEVCGHLSDEPRRCTFPMNCLYSTCRLTLIPDGWSATRKLSLELTVPGIGAGRGRLYLASRVKLAKESRRVANFRVARHSGTTHRFPSKIVPICVSGLSMPFTAPSFYTVHILNGAKGPRA